MRLTDISDRAIPTYPVRYFNEQSGRFFKMKFLKSINLEKGIWNGGNHLDMKWPIVYDKEFSVWFLEHFEQPFVTKPSENGMVFWTTLDAAINAADKE